MKSRERLTEIISKFINLISKQLPDDVMKGLEDLRDSERSPLASELYQCIFKNLEMARKLDRPICQDTGVVQFFLKAGTKFPYIDIVEEVLRDAVLDATEKAPLRHNVVEAFSEKNTGNNVGTLAPWIEWEITPGGRDLYFDVYFAGGGCSLPGRSKVLMPSEGYEGIARYVFDTVVDWGINACPPLVVGVGIGTCAPTAAILSKKAMLRKIGSVNPDPMAADMEKRMKDGLNAIGIGPLGLTGSGSVQDVHIEYAAHHPATLAVGVTVGCWATRRGSVTIKEDLSYVIHSHKEAIL